MPSINCEYPHNSLLKFGPPILPGFALCSQQEHTNARRRSGAAAPPSASNQSSAASQRFSRIVGVECEWTLAEIRKRNQQRTENDKVVSQLYTTAPNEGNTYVVPPNCSVIEGNRATKVIVASTDMDNTHTYLEVQSLQSVGHRRQIVAMFAGRRDIVHASVSSPTPTGEILILFTERELLPATLPSSEEYHYRLFICATKPPRDVSGGASTVSPSGSIPAMTSTTQLTNPPSSERQIGGSVAAAPTAALAHSMVVGSFATSANESFAPGAVCQLPFCLLDITPGQQYCRQDNGNPAYHVAYFLKSEEKKTHQTFLLASDNTDMGLCLQQAHYSSKGNRSSILIDMHEKWRLAKNQFWHQWDPFTQRIVFAVNCVAFIKFRMITMEGGPDARQPFFERNVKPHSLHVHQGSPHSAPFAGANATSNFETHAQVLNIRYECGTEDFALCTQAMRAGKHVRHGSLSSQVIVTITLLRNHLKEGRVSIDIPFRIRKKNRNKPAYPCHGPDAPPTSRAMESTAVFVSERADPADQDVMEDVSRQTTENISITCAERDAVQSREILIDELEDDRDSDWRACFVYTRGMIAIVFPHGPIHFVDVGHKERSPTYLFGSSDLVFRSPCEAELKAKCPQTCGLHLFRHALAEVRRSGQHPPVLSTLPTPVGNIIYVAGTTIAATVDICGASAWRFIKDALHQRKSRHNYHVLLHTAVHMLSTHLPLRNDGYSLNYLSELLLSGNHSADDPDTQGDSRCILGSDVLCELLLGECYGRVRAASRTSGCQIHLLLPMTDDQGIMERHEELFVSLRLSNALANIADETRRMRRRALTNVAALGATAAQGDQASPHHQGPIQASPPARPHRNTAVGSSQAATSNAQEASPPSINKNFLFPHFRFHHMLFHNHVQPPVPERNSADKGHLERCYSFGTICEPSVKDIHDECSLTSDSWFTKHVLTSEAEGNRVVKFFAKKKEIAIKRISLKHNKRNLDQPFGSFMRTLLEANFAPQAEAHRLSNMYTEKMSQLVDDIVEVVSRPPTILHPHKQVMFLLNLSTALESIQFPWRGPLRKRFAKLLLEHVPLPLLVRGIRSRTIPVELDEVIHFFSPMHRFSVWVEKLVEDVKCSRAKRAETDRRKMRQRTRQQSESDESGSEAAERAKVPPVPALPSPLEYFGRKRPPQGRAGSGFASHIRSRGWMHCAGSIHEHHLHSFSTLVSSSSMNGTAVSFDDFDKQLVMAEVFPCSTLQFYRNQLPLDGFVPSYTPLRSFANWKATEDGGASQTRRMQPQFTAIATTHGISKPTARQEPFDETMLLAHKRRIVEDSLVRLVYPFASNPQLSPTPVA
jgi:hypothetical protein